jgi:hypothetical protein
MSFRRQTRHADMRFGFEVPGKHVCEMHVRVRNRGTDMTGCDHFLIADFAHKNSHYLISLCFGGPPNGSKDHGSLLHAFRNQTQTFAMLNTRVYQVRRLCTASYARKANRSHTIMPISLLVFQNT